MKLNSPIPASLAKECEKAAKVLNAFIDPKVSKSVDKVIPKNILDRCNGIAILTVIKAGFIWSGRVGSGLVFARLPDGRWSAPSAIGTAGVGVGGQIGAELTDFVMILNTKSAVKAFSHGGNVTLGGNIGVSAGPFGRSAEVSGALLNVAPVFSYSKSKGLFAGVSLEGSVILERKDANEKFYGRRVTASELLTGKVDPPPQASALYRAIELKSAGTYNMYNSPSPGLNQNDAPGNNILSYLLLKHQIIAFTNSFVCIKRLGTSRPHTISAYGSNPYGSNSSRLNQPVISRDISPANSSNRFSNSNISSGPPNYHEITGTDSYASADKKSRFSMPQANDYHNQQLRGVGTLGAGRAPPPPPPTVASMPPVPPLPRKKTATALYTFNGDAPGDLKFSKGDVITITKSTDTQDDWWEGSCNGFSGQVSPFYF
ncbi:SH3 domain-containing protein [Smittium culicis]|uniref:SH3 domain-containing protein n=1 Tax=Smittium culicis TaxID=133412 RepID=A0A1R1YMW3_9FUNG|nr:SH3 domain-containing protein [Smittium culicis]